MLIRNAEIWGHGLADLRIADGRIAAVGALTPQDGEPVFDAAGGALLPGLHDHHMHLPATAAAAQSVECGPPAVTTAAEFAAALSAAARTLPPRQWLRGIGYHESVAGMPTRSTLDALVDDRPVRIQHRSGRMWFLNSMAIEALIGGDLAPAGMESVDGVWTGRLFDEDAWLRARLGNTPPDLGAISARHAACGVTGVTEMTPSNDGDALAYYLAQQASGTLKQRCVIAGTLALPGHAAPMLCTGPAKLHLHEADLPDCDATVAFIRAAHAQGRGVAIHCTTEVELVFALSAWADAGTIAGDRVEHAGMARDHLIAYIARLGLAVVSQPHFITERGDQYRAAIPPEEHDHLYRLAAFHRAGIVLAAGSDAPFGDTDPWAAMRAALSRQTRGGAVIGADEALSPEQAVALYLADPIHLDRQRQIRPGSPADLCLLDRPWHAARERLVADDVRAVWIAGSCVDQ